MKFTISSQEMPAANIFAVQALEKAGGGGIVVFFFFLKRLSAFCFARERRGEHILMSRDVVTIEKGGIADGDNKNFEAFNCWRIRIRIRRDLLIAILVCMR